MLRQTTLRYFIILFILFSHAGFAASWKNISPGIEYQDLGLNAFAPWSHIHVFRINLTKTRLAIISAKDIQQHDATIEDFSKKTDAFIAINGGFFDKKYQPLGLRITNKLQNNPIKPVSWWGIFQTKADHASIIHHNQFHPHNIEFAIQSGPRLLIHKKIPHLKPGFAERTALGITKNGQIILLVTENAPMTTIGLAEIMRTKPLFCTDALNLDGGSSSQVYAKINQFEIKSKSYVPLTDAILVFPKVKK